MVIREMPIFVLSHENSRMLKGGGQMVERDGGCIKYEKRKKKTLQIIGLVTEGIKQHSYLAVNILLPKYAF